MDSNSKQPLSKMGEVPGAIKEIEHENSSEDISSENENSKNNEKNSQSKSKTGSEADSQISKKIDDLGQKLDLKQSDEESEKKSNESEKEKEEKEIEKDKNSESAESSEDEGAKNESKSVSNSQYQEIKEANFHSIEEYYAELRKVYNEKNQYKDPEFSDVKNFFGSEEDEDDERNLSDIGFDRIVYDDNKVNFFVYENSSNNLDYEFKIKRGIMKDRYFLGAFLMLFRRREEFFTDLILDPQHLEENINAGFIGFTFFINGEWKNVTIDTTVPRHGDEISLSNIETANAYWMCLFEKAYAKVFKTYTVLEMKGIGDFLVDFTGGWSKMTEFSNNKDMGLDENKKKSLFEEIQRALEIKSLVGCMKYDKTKEKEDLEEDKSEEGVEDEAIVPNCMYNILDAREDNGIKLIYLVNYWPKGKWTSSYSVEDETWEANKALAERLNYQVSQSDGTFWMSFDDWLTYFNRIYYCRIFPETWSQMVIPGKWTSVTSGGAPPKVSPWHPEKFIQKENKKDLFGAMGTPSMMAQSMLKGLNKKTMGQTSLYQSPALGGKTTMLPNNALTSNKLGQMISKKGLAPSIRVQPSINTINSKAISQKSGTDKKSNLNSNTTQNQNQNKATEDKTSKTVKSKKKQVAKVVYNPIKRNTIIDTEDRFFLNPQYKIEITPGTRLNISLMQEDKKTQENNYLSVAFLLIYCKGRYSRVWEIKQENIIRKAISEFENPDDPSEKLNKRETTIQLDYYETLKKINEGRKKKIPRGEPIQMNLIPYIDYNTKYETERQGKLVQFKIHAVETVFWLRLFASTNIYVNELSRPYECSASSSWNQDKNFSAGGARYITERGKTRENPKWPINPQYLITFDKNISMKIILKKTNGHFSVEDNKIGFLMTKPEKDQEIISNKSKTTNEFNRTMGNPFQKTDQISRVMESTQRILNPKKNLLLDIYPKMFINNSEWVAESSYGNSYCSCLFMRFNKIDSPLILIPTLDLPNSPFDFELKIYSNREARVFSLNNENCSLLIGEWKENNCGGCHLSRDDKKKKTNNEIDDYSGMVKKPLTWYNNPKFHLSFEFKKNKEDKKENKKDNTNNNNSKDNNNKIEEQKEEDKNNEDENNLNNNNEEENKENTNIMENYIPKVDFEVVLTRFERIWKPIISRGVVNSMLGIYVFEYDTISWKKKCINFNTVEFMPQNEVSVKFSLRDVNPKGFIIMPVTYGEGIKGPFLIMAKCKTRFNFTQLDDNFE